MSYQSLLRERERLTQQCRSLQQQINTFPKGKLLCVKNGAYIKYFKSNGSSPVYLSRKERKLAETLAAKKYYSEQMKDIEQQIHLLDQYLNAIQSISDHSNSLLDESSLYHTLLHSYLQNYPNEIQQWNTEEYEHNTRHSDHLIYKCVSGHYVRSKSEVIIANALYMHKIPYRYECGMHLDDLILFPDFTILNPKTATTLYWEHFGMMNNRTYSENAFNKLKIYSLHGIIPSINLITTYETQNSPIDSEYIEKMIEEYLQ